MISMSSLSPSHKSMTALILIEAKLCTSMFLTIRDASPLARCFVRIQAAHPCWLALGLLP